MDNRKGFRRFQLLCMGWVSIAIAPAVLITATAVHGYPFPQSISETATMANTAAPILPFALGALALFSLSYAVRYAYDYFWDRVFTLFMFAGFTVVAMFPCASPYVEGQGAGVIAVTPEVSGWLHNAGALVGFGAIICWILICFRKSDLPKRARTGQKNRRNVCYSFFGWGMLGAMAVFASDLLGLFGDGFPVVFAVEVILLVFAGAACLLKSGLVLKDD